MVEGRVGRRLLLLLGMITGEFVDGIVVEGRVGGGRRVLLLVLILVLSGIDGIIVGR